MCRFCCMVQVIKASGEREKFNSHKISQSIMNAGVAHEIAEAIAKRVQEKVRRETISTEKIRHITLKQLQKHPGAAARYDLKRSIMQLGPTGFPFERYFALILQAHGYSVSVGEVLKGAYITHEVDVVAKKKLRYMVECKFHNKNGIQTRVKVPLYVYGRFLDLKHYFDAPWLVTNTKCSRDVKDYAKGVQMRVTSWDYPRGEGLKDLVSEKQLYPITILRNIRDRDKEQLFNHNIFLVKQLLEVSCEMLQKRVHFSKRQCKKILDEARAIMNL